MKKRLLSAALALAMALTLLPATVFAADPPKVNSSLSMPTDSGEKSYTVSRQVGDDPASGRLDGHWYWLDNTSTDGQKQPRYVEATAGIIVGTRWFADTTALGKVYPTTTTTSLNITLLGTTTVALTGYDNLSSLVVELNGCSLTLPSTITKLSTLTVTNQWATTNTASIGAVTKTGTKYSNTSTANADAKAITGMTINITNATVTSIDLESGLSNTVWLHNGANVGAITLDGTNTDANGNNTYAAQTLRTDGASQITGAVNITGANSQVSLANVTGGSAVNLNSTGGSFAVSGQSNIGGVTIKTNATTATAAAYPSINITGGTVTGLNLGKDTTTTSSPTVTISGATIGGQVWMRSGTLNINNGTTVQDKTTMYSGNLNVTSTTGVTMGNVVLNLNGKTTFRVIGSNVTTGDIEAKGVSNLTIDIPDNLTNKFDELKLGTYAGGGIKGGRFKTGANDATTAAYFASTVRFRVREGTGENLYWRYYNENDLAAAINYLGNSGSVNDNIILVGHSGGGKSVTLQNGAELAKTVRIYFSKPAAFKLPAVLLGDTITKWTLENTTVNYDPTGTFTIDDATKDYTLLGQDAGLQVNPSKLIKVTVNSTENYTKGIRATLVGNVITLTGAINTDGGMTVIPLTLETDVRNKETSTPNGGGTATETGVYKTINVSAVYNNNSKTVTFGMSAAPELGAQGIVLTETTLTMSNGGAVYTLNASGLGTPAPSLKTLTTSKQVQVTVDKSGWNQYQNKALADRLVNGAEFTWDAAPAMLQAINAAQLTINNETTLQNWVTTAQNYIWRYGNSFAGNEAGKGVGQKDMSPHTTSAPTDAQRTAATTLTSRYSTVWLVPYLQVTVTDVNESTGYMTLTLTPSYRVDVSGASYAANEYYTVQAGRTLGAIAGDMGTGVTVKLGGLTTPLSGAWMHQDNTYAYAGASSSWTILHGSSNGLGSMVLNTTKPLIELQNKNGVSAGSTDAAKLWYDSLQAAVDDTKYVAKDEEVDVVAISAGYTGNGAISVSGDARTFKIKVEGNTLISSGASGDTVKVTGGGHDYVIQLLKNVLPQNAVSITVNTAVGGSASANTSSAKPGDTVTITPRAASGYKVSSVTAVTNTGASVPVSANTNGTYTFTMPADATKVTVTPTFVLDNGLPFTDVTTTDGFYNAVKYCYEKGMINGTTTTTYAPYSTITRAQIVTILWRQAGAQVQTPTSLYKDMPANSDYYNAIIWATRNGVATGYEDGCFYPNRAINRQELATFLYRYQTSYLKRSATSSLGNLNGYYDGYQTGSWAQPAMRWAVGNGIVTGTGTVLSPTSAAPRWQAASAMYQYCSGVLGIK